MPLNHCSFREDSSAYRGWAVSNESYKICKKFADASEPYPPIVGEKNPATAGIYMKNHLIIYFIFYSAFGSLYKKSSITTKSVLLLSCLPLSNAWVPEVIRTLVILLFGK
jgi:hypothetical protein